VTSHASCTRVIGNGAWPKVSSSNHGGTVDWIVLDARPLIIGRRSRYLRLVT